MKFEETFLGRPNTVQTYTSLFNKHIKPHSAHITDWDSWDNLTTLDFLRLWDRQNLAPRTRQMLLNLLAKWVKFNGGPAIETKHLARLIARSQQEPELLTLNKAEAEALMDSCKRLEPKFYPILLLALHGGLRRGEIFGLRCEDVDLFKGKVKVSRSYNGPTKNGKTRYVPMSTDLISTMLSIRNVFLRPAEERIFEQMNPNYVLRRLCAHAGVPIIRFHDLRHTFATLALESGISPRQVANWLGHSSVTTTLSIYWNLTQDESDINTFLPGGKQNE
jgi:integrase